MPDPRRLVFESRRFSRDLFYCDIWLVSGDFIPGLCHGINVINWSACDNRYFSEAPAFPTNNRMVTSWFPEHERASAVGFYTSGQFVGLAFLTPLLIWIQEMLSWHWVFIVTGGIGIIWSLIWFKVYQPPRLTKGISKAELDYIRDGGGLVDGDAPVKKEARQPLTAKDWKLVFHRKPIVRLSWAICGGFYTVVFLNLGSRTI